MGLIEKQAAKIVDLDTMRTEREKLRSSGKTVAFTNGCFDILHAGHADYLVFAKEQSDVLVVGLNSDRSVKMNKGDDRPLNQEKDRARMLAALEVVDFVVVFSDETPIALIETLLPDVLIKGEDWAHCVVGREIVEANGGRVALAPLTEGRSTTNMVEKIRNLTSDSCS